jgi:hypothetical protein
MFLEFSVELHTKILSTVYSCCNFEDILSLLSTSKSVCKLFLSQAKFFKRNGKKLKFIVKNDKLKAGSWLIFFKDTTLSVSKIGNIQHLVERWYPHVRFSRDFCPNMWIKNHAAMLFGNASIMIKLPYMGHINPKYLAHQIVSLDNVMVNDQTLRAMGSVTTLSLNKCIIRADNLPIDRKIFEYVKITETEIRGNNEYNAIKSLTAKHFEMIYAIVGSDATKHIFNSQVKTLHLINFSIEFAPDNSFWEILRSAAKLTKLVFLAGTSEDILPHLHLIPNLTSLTIDIDGNSDLELIAKCSKLEELYLFNSEQLIFDLPRNFPAIELLILHNIDIRAQNLKLKHLFLKCETKPEHNFENAMNSFTELRVISFEKVFSENNGYMIPFHPLLLKCALIHLSDGIDFVDGDNSVEYRQRIFFNKIWSDTKFEYQTRNPAWLEWLCEPFVEPTFFCESAGRLIE